MRWIHIDDITEFRAGEYARAVRSIPADADFLRDHYPGFPLAPHSLLIESMAQTAGILLGQKFNFERDVILAKIDRAEFLTVTLPGDLLVIEAHMGEFREEGAKMECSIKRGREIVARGSLVFALLGERDASKLGARNFVFGSGAQESIFLRMAGLRGKREGQS